MNRRRLYAIRAIVAVVFPLLPVFCAAVTPQACYHTKTAKVLDGRFEDWTEPPVLLAGNNWRVDANAKPIYGGTYDCSASLRLAWDANALYLALGVVDDVFFPSTVETIDSTDAVYLTLSPLETTDTTEPLMLACALRPMAQVYRIDSDGAYLEAPDIKVGISRSLLSAPKTPMPHEDDKVVPAKISKILYEFAVPWAQLGITPSDGGIVGLGVQILDNDGHSLRGSLKWRGKSGVPLTANGLGQVCLTTQHPSTSH